MPNAVSFDEVLTEAVNYFVTRGFQNSETLTYWTKRLEIAARNELMSTTTLRRRMKDALAAEYRRQIERGLVLSYHAGLSKGILNSFRLDLKGILSKRLSAANALITLNREEDIAATLRKFTGWASSLPEGSSSQANRSEIRRDIKRALVAAKNKEANLVIDQRHKLHAALNAQIAQGGGAIAAIWVSHHTVPGYDFRELHQTYAQRSSVRPFLIRGSWAVTQGLISSAGATFTDQLDHQPGQLPHCKCHYLYIYSTDKLPEDMRKRAA